MYTLNVKIGLIPLDQTSVLLETQSYTLSDLPIGQAYSDGDAFGIDGYFSTDDGIAAFHVAAFTAEDGDCAELLVHRGTHIEYWSYGTVS
jgi:hypothetical protein